MKNRIETPVEKLMENEVLERPISRSNGGFYHKTAISSKKNEILVVCDKLTKITYFVETTERILAEGLTRLFKDNMSKLYRLLESIISDREL